MMAAPLPLSVKVGPLGSGSDSVRAGGGYLVARMISCGAAG